MLPLCAISFINFSCQPSDRLSFQTYSRLWASFAETEPRETHTVKKKLCSFPRHLHDSLNYVQRILNTAKISLEFCVDRTTIETCLGRELRSLHSSSVQRVPYTNRREGGVEGCRGKDDNERNCKWNDSRLIKSLGLMGLGGACRGSLKPRPEPAVV